MVNNMKALCCACVVCFSLNVIAAGNQAQPVNKPAPKQAVASTAKAAEKVLGGVVTAVNAEKKEISILRNSVSYPVIANATTQIVSGKEPIDFSTIAVGDKVTVNYTKQSDGTRVALEIEKKSSATVPPEPAKSKAHVKAEQKKAEMPKAEVKAEPKKTEMPAVSAPAAPKAEVKAEPKKVVAPVVAAPAAPKVEVKAEPKKAETPAVSAPAAPKVEVKAEPKKPEAPVVAPVKTETKAAPK
jgi:hypothetical protein